VEHRRTTYSLDLATRAKVGRGRSIRAGNNVRSLGGYDHPTAGGGRRWCRRRIERIELVGCCSLFTIAGPGRDRGQGTESVQTIGAPTAGVSGFASAAARWTIEGSSNQALCRYGCE
jgi:hypothetical protein